MPDAPTPTPNQYEQERRDKLRKLRDLGIDPYGQRIDGLDTLEAIREQHSPDHGQDGGPTVKGQGRIVLKRDMGKLSFLTLRDATGDLQIALDKRRLPELDWQVRGLLDLGDRLAFEGPLGQTNKGEVTVWCAGITFSGKALVPPPDKYHGLEDQELRYRQRYTDLWANPEVMDLAKTRALVVRHIREFLQARGYTEVETPMLQNLQGGAAARPFTTHHNALDLPLYLRIAPELYLKRLLVGGMDKVFELNRNFRNEGVSPRHNPEFTMLEAYEAYGSWETMAEWVEELVCELAMKLHGTLKIEHKDAEGNITRTIDLTRPWRRATMAELVEEHTSIPFKGKCLNEQSLDYDDRDEEMPGWEGLDELLFEPQARAWMVQHGENPDAFAGEELDRHSLDRINDFVSLSPAEQLVYLYEQLVEPTLIDPCFVTRVPSAIIPLAKPCADDPFYADVYELAINGQEISPGYTELNDPDVQARLFREQVGEEAEKQQIDYDFLNALKVGMPPAGGMGLGVDRLVMLLTGAKSIRDVILFPLMRPEQ